MDRQPEWHIEVGVPPKNELNTSVSLATLNTIGPFDTVQN